MDEREVLRYLPRSFYIKWTRTSLRNMVFIRDLDSFNYKQVKAFTEGDMQLAAHRISGH